MLSSHLTNDFGKYIYLIIIYNFRIESLSRRLWNRFRDIRFLESILFKEPLSILFPQFSPRKLLFYILLWYQTKACVYLNVFFFLKNINLGTNIISTETYLPSKPRPIYQVLKLQCYFYGFP